MNAGARHLAGLLSGGLCGFAGEHVPGVVHCGVEASKRTGSVFHGSGGLVPVRDVADEGLGAAPGCLYAGRQCFQPAGPRCEQGNATAFFVKESDR